MLIVTTTEGEPGPPAVSLLGVRTDDAKRCVGHQSEIEWGYVKQVDTSVMTARVVGQLLTAE